MPATKRGGFPVNYVKITVLTPTFNRADTLVRAIDSVLGQTQAPVEHLILDNLSADRTSDVVADYARRAAYPVVHLRERDSGMYDALNKGLTRASGDAIYILNDDDAIADPQVLHLLSTCMEQTSADLVYGDVFWLDPQTGRKTARRHNQVNKLTLVHKGMNQPAMLHRATLFQQCGNYDVSYRIAGDHEWLLRVFLGHRIAATYLRHPVAICSLGGLSNAEQWRKRASEERHRALGQWYNERELSRSQLYRKYVRKLPLGTHLFHWFEPLKLRITSVRPVKGGFAPDWAAALGY